jgi:hypothetical protein
MKARNKCLRCKKNFKRHSKRILETERYKGNLICYREKLNEFTKKWSYVLWDGESYWLTWKPFCSKECAARYAVKKFD